MIQKFGEESKHSTKISCSPLCKVEKLGDKKVTWKEFAAAKSNDCQVKMDQRQKRYDLNEKAKIIAYMNYRESEEQKSNLSWYAEDHGVSRATMYNIYNDFKEKFQNDPPGPKTTDEKVVENLREELRAKQEEIDVLEQLLEEQGMEAEQEKKRRVVAALLQAAVSPMSMRDIRDLLATAFDVHLSKRKIKKLIAEYSNRARRILAEMDLGEHAEMLAVDEVFAGGSPILTGVEMNSFAVLICERETSRTHQEWYRVLGPFPHLKLVISDKAKGIVKAVRLRAEDLRHPLLHQFDVFHFKRDMGRTVRHLEASAYREIESEYKAEASLEKAKTQEERSGMIEKHRKNKERAQEACEIYDSAADAMTAACQSLEIFDEEGTLNDPGANLRRIEKETGNLQKTASRMPKKSKNHNDMMSVIRQLQDPGLTLYLVQLETRLLDIMCLWNERTTTRREAIKVLCESWYWEKRGDVREYEACAKRLAVMLQVRRLQMELANFGEVRREVCDALNAACRASSLVESFNSRIRIYQQVKKGLHKNFLYLVALKWNLTPFDGGRRKGKSPCQMMGVTLKSNNWLELLLAA
jgi:hypothetical protein